MATKIKLGQRPQTFAPITVTFKLPEGGEGCMQITPKYFTRTEFGKLLDSINNSPKPVVPEAEDAASETETEFKPISMEEMQAKLVSQSADYLVQVLHAWNLDGQELNRQTLQELADGYPAAITAMISAVREAINEGRLGN